MSRILVVEDSLTQALKLQLMLENEGCDVECAATAEEAIDALNRNVPDLVIVDIARVDAEEVADTYPDVPILGYTNHTDTAGLRAGHAAGFDQVVAKSALFDRTRELIDALLASVE